MTVKNILSHTSGLPPMSPLERQAYMQPPRLQVDGLPLATAVRSYAMSPLTFQPGTKWQYCNADINTAGRIIEVVSGMPYEQFLAKRLLEPLGMKDTTFWPNRRSSNVWRSPTSPSPSRAAWKKSTSTSSLIPWMVLIAIPARPAACFPPPATFPCSAA